MSEMSATARLRLAVRAVILAEDDGVLLCRFSFPPPAMPTATTGVVNDYFLVRTTRFDPRGALSDDDLAAEHISGMRWWRYDEIADYGGTDLFSPRDLATPLAALIAGDLPRTPPMLGL